MASSTAWTRYPRNLTAFRGDGEGRLTLEGHDGRWTLTVAGGEKIVIAAEPRVGMDAVIAVVDLLGGEPSIVGATTGFEVKQHFSTCDRARKWVDLRVDRVGGIRGPRTRTAAVADRTLPDVRVTSAERSDALGLAERLGVSYSTFVRASLKLIAVLAEKGDLQVSARDQGDAEFSLKSSTQG